MAEVVFEKIQRLVFDENKLVTYKSLCQHLDVSANKAKLYLSDFLKKYDMKNNLCTLYLLSGVFSDENSLKCSKIMIVTDDALDKAKRKFSSVSSCHVYGIQQGTLADENALYASDYIKAGEPGDYTKFSSIRNPNVKIQSVGSVRTVIDKQVKEEPKLQSTANNKQTLPKTEKATAAKNKGANIFSMMQKKSEAPKKSPSKSNVKESNGVTVPSSSSKAKNASPEKKKTPEKVSRTESSGNKNDVKYFFSRQAEKKTEKAEKKTEIKKVEVKPTIPQSGSRGPTTTNRLSNQKKSKRSESRAKERLDSDSDDDMKPKKKRKRILQMDDSDSESDNEQAQDKARRDLFMSEPPPPPPPVAAVESDEELVPPTPPVIAGKKKKWKMVTKTFEDEDGFFVTKRTKEFVTDSEESANERTSPFKSSPVKEIAKKKLVAVNKKQASLTSFFSRK